MTALERRIDVCLRYIAANDETERSLLAEKARELLSEIRDNENLDIRQRTEELLTFVGVPCNLKGYDYLTEAITMCVEDPNFLHDLCEGLYPDVGKKFNCSMRCVERNMRHAVSYVFDNTDIDVLTQLFGNSVSMKTGVATNGQFIAVLAKEIRRQI